jgi:hypothetical protein
VRRVAIVLVGASLAALAFTLWALESSEVAVLVTRRADATPRETHVWWAEHAGAIWLEAATPQREWLADALLRPDVELVRAGQRAAYRAERVADGAGHTRVRSLLREKYGFRDVWVGLLQDTSRSVAVRLLPRESSSGGES